MLTSKESWCQGVGGVLTSEEGVLLRQRGCSQGVRDVLTGGEGRKKAARVEKGGSRAPTTSVAVLLRNFREGARAQLSLARLFFPECVLTDS